MRRRGSARSPLSRRACLQLLATATAGLASAGVVAACGSTTVTPGTSTASGTTSGTVTASATATTAAQPAVTMSTAASPTGGAAATSNGATPPATRAVAGAVVPLSFSTWGAGGGAYSAEDKVVEAFNRAHPGIQARLVEIPFTTYRDKLLAEFSAGDAPDTMAIDHDMFPYMVQRSVFAKLDALVAGEKAVLDDYFQTALDGFRYQGALYGLPTGGSAYCLWWSPRLFQEAGLATPNDLMAKGQWTWPAFLDAAEKLTGAQGGTQRFGADTGISSSSIAPWVWGNGGHYLSADQQQLLLDEPASVDAIQFLHDLIWTRHVAAPPGQGPGAIKAFIAGDLAMYTTWGGTAMAQFQPVKDLSWDVALPPVKDGKTFVTWAPLNPMCINAQPKHLEESWTFERWYNGTPGMTIFGQNGRVPVAKSVLNSPDYLKATPPAHKEVILQGMQVGRPGFTNPNWTVANDKLGPFLTDIAKNSKPSAETLQQAAALIDPILSGQVKG